MPLAARPMHQHRSMLNFKPFRRLILRSRVTSKVLKSVTMGTGDFIHIAKASARVVSWGFISCFILYSFFRLSGSVRARLCEMWFWDTKIQHFSE